MQAKEEHLVLAIQKGCNSCWPPWSLATLGKDEIAGDELTHDDNHFGVKVSSVLSRSILVRPRWSMGQNDDSSLYDTPVPLPGGQGRPFLWIVYVFYFLDLGHVYP